MLWPILGAILGAIAGSFIAALVIRWTTDRSIAKGRSVCDACGHVLRAIDLIPLISTVVLRGRCRDCGARIDPLHTRIELLALAIGAAAGFVAPGPLGIAGAVFGWVLLTLAALDLIAFWLPDRLTVALAVTGLGAGALGATPPLVDRLIGGAAGYLTLAATARVYRRIRGREGMGGGDPKLFGAIGLWLGWQLLPAVLLVACMVGLGVVLAAHLRKQAMTGSTAVPLGTLLAVAAYPAWIAMIVLAP